MLLIGNGCFGELSIILSVTMVCVFSHSIYNNISTGINCPGVSCEYDTYLILRNMYVQVILFASIFSLLFLVNMHILSVRKMSYNKHTKTILLFLHS